VVAETTALAKVFENLLGPTAKYLGEEIAEFAKKRIENVRNIFLNAQGKLADCINSPGAVPPRILAGILTDGSYREDKVAYEYFGRVLASSRTEVPKDDRGATFVSLISRLSSYQLRLHYVIYRVFLDLYGGSNAAITESGSQYRLMTFIPESTLLSAMHFSEREELPDTIFAHALFGLNREELIRVEWAFGSPETLHTIGRQITGYTGAERGLIVSASPHGVELFLHAMGAGTLPINIFFHKSVSFPPIQGVLVQPGSQSLRHVPQASK
jgi:hypothetical protein